MFNKIYAFLRENRKEIIIFLVLLVIFNISFPYYVDSPGGTLSLKKRFEVENSREINGDISLVYVAERRGTIPSILLSFLFKDWDLIKKEEVISPNENEKDVNTRGQINLNQSLNNAIVFAFKKAGKKFEILSSKIYITYIAEEAKTDLKIGDEIIEIDGTKIKNKDEIFSILERSEVGTKLEVIVLEKNKEKKKHFEIIEIEGMKKIGIIIDTIYDYKLSQDVKYKSNSSEMGSSGGFANALYVYATLIDEDIIKGRNVVATGTITEDGVVGAIGGVKYKLKAALKSKADIFFVPSYNCSEATKLKDENNYNINIICINNFDDAINYLKG